MVNWSDPAEIARDADAFNKMIFALFGLYFWEICTTFLFDWSIITGRRPFKWPLIFYFLTRYSLFWALLGLMITITVTSEVNCQALYVFCQWAGNTAIAGASTCLMIRTIAIWERKLFVTIPLVALSLGQWGLLYHGIVTVRASWLPEVGACVVTGTKPLFLNLLYFYTMSLDLIVLILTVLGLMIVNARSSIGALLFRDGIVYFAVAFSANMVPAVLNVLNLNPAMNVIAAVPAATVSAIAACRAVVRLLETRTQEVYVHSSQTGGNSRTMRGTLSKPGFGTTTVGTIGAFNNPAQSHLDMGEGPDDIELDRKMPRFNASEPDLERGWGSGARAI